MELAAVTVSVSAWTTGKARSATPRCVQRLAATKVFVSKARASARAVFMEKRASQSAVLQTVTKTVTASRAVVTVLATGQVTTAAHVAAMGLLSHLCCLRSCPSSRVQLRRRSQQSEQRLHLSVPQTARVMVSAQIWVLVTAKKDIQEAHAKTSAPTSVHIMAIAFTAHVYALPDTRVRIVPRLGAAVGMVLAQQEHALVMRAGLERTVKLNCSALGMRKVLHAMDMVIARVANAFVNPVIIHQIVGPQLKHCSLLAAAWASAASMALAT